MTSPARISANQNNAKLSTGPKSTEGKERSKMNALKHGLRAETIILPTEDPAKFDDMLAEWMDEWKPPTGTRRQLVERTVSAAWRVNRCVRVEAAALADRAEDALAAWDKERDALLDSDVAKLRTEPLQAIQRLRWTREGIQRLIDLWAGLGNALVDPDGWNDIHDHHDRYINLRGYCADDPDSFDFNAASLKLLLSNRPDLPTDEFTCPHSRAVADQVREMMYRYAETMVKGLSAEWSRTRDDNPARARDAELAAFRFTSEDQTLQRYEGRLDRAFRANLGQLILLTKTGIDLVPDDSPTSPEIAPIEAKAEAVATKKVKGKASSKDIAPNEANEIESELTAVQVERDRGGRIWPVEGPIDDDRV